MSLLLKDTVHGVIADSVYNDILSRRSNYYFFLGRVMEWDDQNVPLVPVSTYAYEYETRNDIISLKRVTAADVCYVVRRIDWSTGQVYDQYDPDYSTTYTSSTGATSLKTSEFYVLTSDFNVYKCLDNNFGAISTIMPTGSDVVTLATDDGYVWKYMYTIPLSLRNRFLNEDFMPVQKAILNPYYSNGSIDSVIIDNAGTGYFGNADVTLTVQGIFQGGSGNSIANLRPILSATGQFLDVIIDQKGNNYASANILITDNNNSGTGYYNTAGKANLVPVIYNGQIDRVVINDPGIGYSANNQTTISLIGDGVGASLSPFINSAGQLEDVIITSRGEGYTYLDVEVVGDGTGANAYASFFVGDLDTNQSTVELAAIEGGIYNVKITNAGSGYTQANIVLYGDGQQFTGIINFDNDIIKSVTVLNPGFDYTHANVVIAGNGTGATANVILPPYGGHGYNAVKELYADAVMLYSTINNEKIQGVDVNNDYRQIGIIKDPKQYGNERAFANALGSSCFLVTLDSVNNITADSQLELSLDPSKLFEVIEVVSSTKQILVLGKNNYELTTSNTLYKRSTDTTYSITSINALPTINKFSGDMIYIDNRTRISYSDQQLITIRTVIKL